MPGHEVIGEEERRAVNDVFDRGGVLYPSGFDERREGRYLIEEFEEAVADRIGTDYALFVSSGTAALKIALHGLGVDEGDEVITQSHTFVATVEAALELGATPAVTDVDKTLNMDPDDLEAKISEETAAVVPVHMYGVSARMDRICDIATDYGVPVLEDSAWGLGSSLDGEPLGTIGDVGAYSLNFGKTITTGEGGLLVTDDESVYRAAKEYSNHGHEDNPDLPAGEDTRSRWGFNYKTHELEAAVGLAQLEKLNDIIESQHERKTALRDRLASLDVDISFRERPNPAGESGRAVGVRLDSQEMAASLAEELSERDIGTLNLPSAIKWHFAGEWDHIFADHPEYSGQQLEALWQQSSDLLRRTIAVPVSVSMDSDDIQKVVDSVESATD